MKWLLIALRVLTVLSFTIHFAISAANAQPGTPVAPTILAGTIISPTQIRIDWADNSDNETGFRIERTANGGGFTVTGNVSANVTSFSDNTVTANITFSYRVIAVNAIGDSAPSNVVAVTVAVPNPPSGLATAVVNASRIDLTWTDNSTNESSFLSQRSTDNFTTTTNVTIPANTTAFSDTTVTTNITYQYRLFAVNAVGSSVPSNVASATPSVPARPC